MPTATPEPIRDDDLPDFCAFLNTHLNPAIPAHEWANGFMQDWGGDKPNNGFLIREGGHIVGGIGAIYSSQIIRGKAEHFCNISSWCVLESHRSQSMRLALALTGQHGFHFTNLTPTSVVAGSLRFLKFKPLDDRRTVWPNLPHPLRGGVRVIDEHEAIAAVLEGEAARTFAAHRHLGWLSHVAVGIDGAFCHVVYKRGVLRGLPCAEVLHISDARRFLAWRRQLGHFWLLRNGLLSTRIESRFLPARPALSREIGGYIPKMYRSETLGDADIINLYSELAALDLR